MYRFLPEDNGFSYLGAASDYAAFLQLGIGAVSYSAPETPFHIRYYTLYNNSWLIDPH
jgi:N-acetylated-alpha-linked acidic dipeptidase